MVAEIFFLFLTETLEHNNPMEQGNQEYHNHDQSDSSSEEMEDNNKINPPEDERWVLAANQAQAKWEEL